MANAFKRKGSVLIMVTVALVAMFGIMGLAVDLGWAYFVKKSAQSAADAAALAAVTAAVAGGPVASMTCGGGTVTCAAVPIPCPASGNLQIGCLYAAQNGFSPATAQQNVLIQASDAATAPTVSGCTPTVQHPPTAPCVDTPYWVTVRVSQQIPQLFSSVLGNAMATVSARSTAAVALAEAIGSLILLNRENDLWIETTGTNMFHGGGPTVNVPGGIKLSSNSTSAGRIQGSGQVISPFTHVRTGGGVNVSGAGTWTAAPTNRPDGEGFYDPFRNRTQLPTNPNQHLLPNRPVLEGPGSSAELNDTVCPGWVCQPGNYYAVNSAGTPTGRPIVVDLAPSTPLSFAGSSPGFANFGDYVFFGGMQMDRGVVNFGPGRYVMAGVANASTPVFELNNGVRVVGGSSFGSDAGRAFIFTDGSYEGRLTQTRAAIPGLPSLQFGKASFKSGNNAASGVDLFGFDPANSDVLTAGLEHYPVVMWQDRMNSNIRYDANGNLDYSSCGGSINSPCTNPHNVNRELEVTATPNTRYGGAIYQPRGAWTRLVGGGNYNGAMQLITGGLRIQGNGNITLSSPVVPVTTFVAALVE